MASASKFKNTTANCDSPNRLNNRRMDDYFNLEDLLSVSDDELLRETPPRAAPRPSGGVVHGRGKGPAAARVKRAGAGLGSIAQAERQAAQFSERAVEAFALALFVHRIESNNAKTWVAEEAAEQALDENPAVPHPCRQTQRERVKSIIDSVDKRSRCNMTRPPNSDFSDPLWAYKPENFRPYLPPMNGMAFEYALRCYVPPDNYGNEADLWRCSDYDTPECLGPRTRPRYCHLEWDAYGKNHDLGGLFDHYYDEYCRVADVTSGMIRTEKGREYMHGTLLNIICHPSVGGCYSHYAKFVAGVKTYYKQNPSSPMLHDIRRWYTLLQGADAVVDTIKNKVKQIRARMPSHCWLVDTAGSSTAFPDDARDLFIDHLEAADAINLMQSCRYFYSGKVLEKMRERLPMPRVRHVGISADKYGCNAAPFPHARYGLAGEQIAYVSADRNIQLYVDFVQKQLWPKSAGEPLHLLRQKNDPDHERPPRDVKLVAAVQVVRRAHNYPATGPREERTEDYYYERLDSYSCFERGDLVQYRATLVYADTKEPVKPTRGKPCLEPKLRSMHERDGAFVPIKREQRRRYIEADRRMVTEFVGEPRPAFAELRVHELSSKHNHRQFRIQIKLFYQHQHWHHIPDYYTEPFTTTSRLDQVCPVRLSGPEKRKMRAEEEAANERIRQRAAA